MVRKKSPPGSPPRRRGKGSKADVECLRSRITLAWAGKSRSAISAHSVGQDHPRVGEEKFEDVRNIVGQIGSSPRGRGKVGAALRKERLSRITPAWAGKSKTRRLRGRHSEDHPRVGGEKLRSGRTLACGRGSPPRGRGKAGLLELSKESVGITPA